MSAMERITGAGDYQPLIASIEDHNDDH